MFRLISESGTIPMTMMIIGGIIGFIIGTFFSACQLSALLWLQGLKIRFRDCLGGVFTISVFSTLIYITTYSIGWCGEILLDSAVQYHSENMMMMASLLGWSILFLLIYGSWVQYKVLMELFKTSFFHIFIVHISNIFTLFAFYAFYLHYFTFGGTIIILVILINYFLRPANLRFVFFSIIIDLFDQLQHNVSVSVKEIANKPLLTFSSSKTVIIV